MYLTYRYRMTARGTPSLHNPLHYRSLPGAEHAAMNKPIAIRYSAHVLHFTTYYNFMMRIPGTYIIRIMYMYCSIACMRLV